MKNFLLLWCGLGLMWSCSKNSDSAETNKDIPTFSNIEIKLEPKSTLQNRTEILKKLNLYYQNIWQNSEMSGGLLVAKDGEILLEKYQGFGRENGQMPINAETPLHIASVSKPFTAMAILKLVEHKKLDLHQKINTILPKFSYEKVTIFHLLSHRSGLPKYENFLEEAKFQPKQKFVSNQEVLDFMIRQKPALARETDTGFMYNNTNYLLLALIIEKITQKSFPEAMKLIIFEPLAMKNTFVFEEKHLHTASQSFYQRGNKLYPLNEYDLIYGDKNIYTTPRDLLRFSQAMQDPKFLPKALMEKVFTPYSNEKKGVNNYGLGFRMKIFDNGKKLTYHNGWWHGSNAVFVHILDTNTTIIALGNKYSRKIYSAMALSSLFDDYPYELEKIISPNEKFEENLE